MKERFDSDFVLVSETDFLFSEADLDFVMK